MHTEGKILLIIMLIPVSFEGVKEKGTFRHIWGLQGRCKDRNYKWRLRGLCTSWRKLIASRFQSCWRERLQRNKRLASLHERETSIVEEVMSRFTVKEYRQECFLFSLFFLCKENTQNMAGSYFVTAASTTTTLSVSKCKERREEGTSS
jgi:hypothetical protein